MSSSRPSRKRLKHISRRSPLFQAPSRVAYAVAAHSFAEAYNILTGGGERGPFRIEPLVAWAALESLRAVTDLADLTGAQTFDAIGRYARSGGVGARLYNGLIGEAAVAHGIPNIISWNVRHMRSLFPRLNVVAPTE